MDLKCLHQNIKTLNVLTANTETHLLTSPSLQAHFSCLFIAEH